MYSGRANHRAGVSLVEAMVASSISLLLLAALAYVFQARQVHSERISARIELNEVALTALGHLKREVGEASLRCVDMSDAGVLVFASPRTADGEFANSTGGLQYHKMVCYRRVVGTEESTLVRQEELFGLPTADPPEPASMAPPRDRAYFESSALPERVVARGATLFEVRLDSLDVDDIRAGRIHFTLALQREVRDRSYGIKVETSVVPRN